MKTADKILGVIVGGSALALVIGASYLTGKNDGKIFNRPISKETRIEDVNKDGQLDLVYRNSDGEETTMYGHFDGRLYHKEDLLKLVGDEAKKSLEDKLNPVENK